MGFRKFLYAFAFLSLCIFIPSYEVLGQCRVTITASGPLDFCSGNAIQTRLIANVADAKSYQWLKDGQSLPNATAREYVANAAGKYEVKIESKNSDECTSNAIEITEVDYPAAPDFTFAPNTTECAGTQIQFNIANPLPDITYAWDFGDGKTGSGSSPPHEFIFLETGTKTYNVQVKATNKTNCTSAVTTKTVTVKAGPDLILTDALNPFNPFSNCANSPTSANPDYTIQVTNSSNNKTTITDYAIDWGDGTAKETFPANFTGASHTYKKLGEFKIKFSGTSTNGCVFTREYNAVNQSNPAVGLASFGSTIGCAPLNLQFQLSKYENNSPGTTYIWDFGDGTPLITWDYDDPIANNGLINHSFEKTSCGNANNEFKVTVTAVNGCKSTVISVGSIEVYSKPTPNFTLNKESGCINTPFLFTNTTVPGSYGNQCSGLTNFTLDWGNGTAPVQWSSTSNPPQQTTYPAKGTYTVTLTAENGCGTNTFTKEITIIDPPVASFATSAPTACVGTEVQIANNTTGDNVEYSWSITPNRGYTITSGGLTARNPVFRFDLPGTYTLTLTADNGCTPSTASQTIVITAPPVVTLPAAQTYCGPQVISFSDINTKHAPVFEANGGTISAYNWVVDNGAFFSGGTTAASQYPEITFPVAGTYTVNLTATNECGTSEPATQQIIINAAPDNPIAPDVSICSGSTATLTASGSSGTYNWYAISSGGQAIFTGETFTTSVLTADATFYVEVVSAQNCVSARIPVKVTVNPNITNNNIATDQVICGEGAPVPFTGTTPAGGNGTYTYRWEISSNGIDFADAPGANNTETYAPGTLTQTAWFRRVVISDLCTHTSNIVKVTIQQPPANNTISQDQTICAGQTPAILNGSEVSGNDYTYQWQQSSDNATFTDIGGANSANYNPGVLTQSTWFRRIVKSTVCPESVSNTVAITVNPVPAAPNVTPATICAGETATLTATLAGATLEWYDAASGGNLLFTGDTFTSPVLAATTTYFVQAKALDCVGPRVAVIATVKPLPVVTATPVTQEICTGAAINVQLTANLTGTTFAWTQTSTAGVTGAADGAGSTISQTLANTGTVPGTVTYTITPTSDGCAGAPLTVTVTVNPEIRDNTITGEQTICVGLEANTLTGLVPTGGNGTYTYVWESSMDGANFTTASGNASEKDFAPGTLSQTTWFRRKITSGNCESISDAIKVTTSPAIANNSINANQVICSGEGPTALLGEVPTGGDGTYVYTWESSLDNVNFTPVTAANEKDFTPGNLTQTTYYRRTVQSGGCTISSNVITITVNEKITNNTLTADQIICEGAAPAELTGSTPQGGNNNYQYTWEVSTDNITYAVISDATGQNYQPGTLTQTTWFRRVVMAGPCEAVTSESIKITVNPSLTNNNVNEPQTVCQGTAPSPFTGSLPTGGDGNYLYEWESSTTSASSGFAAAAGVNNGQNYTAGALTQTTWFRRKVSSGNCAIISAAVEVKVNEPISSNAILAASDVLCRATTGPLLRGSDPQGGNGAYEYLWEYSITGESTGFMPASGVNNQKDYQPGAINEQTWFRRIVKAGPCEPNISAVVEFKINDPISQNTISGQQQICAGEQPGALSGVLPQGGSSTYTYLWESSTTGPTTGFAAATGINNEINYTPGVLTQTTWFRRIALSPPCDPNTSAVIMIEVTPGITNNIVTASAEICENTNAPNLTGTQPQGGDNNYTYLWESSLDGVIYTAASGNNTGINYAPGVLTETTWFRRVVKSGYCVNPSASVKITVYKNITANSIGADQEVCVGSTPDDLAGSTPEGGNGNYIYLWESSLDNINFSPAAGINNTKDYQPGAIPQTTWFRRSVTAGPCAPSTSNAIKITITPIIANNTISRPQRICQGSLAAPLVGSTPTGGNGTFTYIWEVSTTSANGPYQVAAGAANNINYEPGYLNQTSWFRRTIFSEGCSNTSRPIQITVDTDITNNTIAVSQVICFNSVPAIIMGETPQGGNGNYRYIWESSTDSINFSPAIGINNAKDYQPPVLRANMWYRRVVVSSPCSDDESNTIRIKVLALITQNRINASQLICYNTVPATLTGTSPAGGTGTYIYLWESSTTSATTGFAPAAGVNNEQNYTGDPLKQTTWFRRVVSSAPCDAITSAAIEVKVKPMVAPPTLVDVTICPGTITTLTANGAADTYEWYDAAQGGQLLFTGKTYTTPQISATTTYYVQSIVDDCPSTRQAVKVDVFEDKANAGEDVTIIKGQKTILQGSGGVKYNWSPATGLSDANIAMPLASPQETTTYTVTVTSAEGCITTDEVVVTVIPKIVVAGGLTPNNDGYNDTWIIRNIEFYPEAQVEVFNRWGNRIFYSQGYAQPWDGKYNGQDLPVAAYFYIIKLSKDEPPVSGSVTLAK